MSKEMHQQTRDVLASLVGTASFRFHHSGGKELAQFMLYMFDILM